VTFTDWRTSSSKTLGQFKDKVGQQKFDEARIEYGQELKNLIDKTINSQSYKKMSDDDKLKTLNDLDSETQDRILKHYHFKYKTISD
jgi:hypothetical protein